MDDDGQAAFHADMLRRRQDEEEALRRVVKGVATMDDAEILARASGHDVRDVLDDTDQLSYQLFDDKETI